MQSSASAGRRSLRVWRCDRLLPGASPQHFGRPTFRWAPRDRPFTHPPHTMQTLFLILQPPNLRGFCGPRPGIRAWVGCLPCVPGGACPAASEASSLDAQTDCMRGRHAHTQGADWRQLWPWAQVRSAHQEPSPGRPERHPNGRRVTNQPSPCGAGTGRGLVAWDARGRVEAAFCLRVRACDWAHLPVCERL